LAVSLEINGYFNSGKLKNDPFEGKVVNISVSGFLFTYPFSGPLTLYLKPGVELSTQLICPRRTISVNSRIMRYHKDKTNGYIGCRFLGMEPEDIRFLFEYLYGRPFTHTDSVDLLHGQV
jgi:hypothetical protein